MIAINKKIDIDKIRFILISLYIFSLPLSIAINNILLVLLTLFWIFFGDKKETIHTIKNNPVVFTVLLFYIFLVFSFLWSSHYQWGLGILLKEKNLLFLPILITLIKDEEKDFFIKTFIISMSISELISYGIKFQIIPAFSRATVYDPTPFMTHIFYNPFLAFTIYLLLFYLIKSSSSKIVKVVSIMFIVTMSINMFITGGRAGQVAYFALITLFILQVLRVNFKSIFIIFIGLPLIFGIFYTSSNIFHQRVDYAINEIKNADKQIHSSLGLRVAFAKDALCVIKKHPILGAGLGDYYKDYQKCNQDIFKGKLNVEKRFKFNPHNMYLFAYATGGILTFLALLAIMFVEIKIGLNSNSCYSYPMVALPILYLVIMLSETYLLQHNSTAMFILFSAILFKNSSWKDLKGKQ